jgi:hypothetical protein
MKQPLSVIIITRDKRTLQEIHNRFDAQTGFPRIKLFFIFCRAVFSL